MVLLAFAQTDGPWTEVFDRGPAMGDDIRDVLRMARSVLDLPAQKEVERMLVQAKAHVADIERHRRRIEDTLSMVVDLINLEAARLGPGGHASPDSTTG